MKDFLIIGQGIAGSLLTHELLKRNQSVDIINNTQLNSSSRIAAGLYNPITGRKMVKTWNCDKIFVGLENYYRDLESNLNSKFLYPIGIYRPFFSAEEQNDWQGKISDPAYSYLVKELKQNPTEDPMVNDPYGGLLLNHSGYLDIPVMLDSFKNYFQDRGIYQEKVFNMQGLKVLEDHCSYEDQQYRRVIFCEGSAARDNPFFDWLPYKLVKGEILDVEIDYNRATILNRGVFLLPLKTNLFRLGATYNNHDLTFDATRQAVDFLKEKLNLIFNGQFEIISHRVGIRPATKDRRPFIGVHPKYSQVGIFNGLGAKGVSLAVLYSEQFVENLLDDKALEPEVNISRFFSLI